MATTSTYTRTAAAVQQQAVLVLLVPQVQRTAQCNTAVVLLPEQIRVELYFVFYLYVLYRKMHSELYCLL